MQPTRRANIEQYRMIAKANSQLIKGHDTDSGGGGRESAEFLLVMCRWPLRAPTPFQSILWPIDLFQEFPYHL